MSEESHETSLNQLYEKYHGMYSYITSRSIDIKDSTEIISKTIECGVKLIQMIGTSQIFSKNETIDDVETKCLKFILVMSFQAELYNNFKIVDRKLSLQTAMELYSRFLKLCEIYSLLDQTQMSQLEDLLSQTESRNSESSSILDMAKDRNAKIARFKAIKSLESSLKAFEGHLDSNNPSVDEEVEREYFLNKIRLQILYSLDAIKMINDELILISHEEINAKTEESRSTQPQPTISEKTNLPNLKIMHIPGPNLNRAELMKKVFGLGYVTVPTMTDEEYFQQEIAERNVLLDTKGITDSDIHKPKPDKDSEEFHDAQTDKDREFDDFKDWHRKGSGNRYRHG